MLFWPAAQSTVRSSTHIWKRAAVSKMALAASLRRLISTAADTPSRREGEFSTSSSVSSLKVCSRDMGGGK